MMHGNLLFFSTFAINLTETKRLMNSLVHRYLNVNGQLLDLSVPQVMGILNVTPDSFYAGSRMQTEADIAQRAQQILSEGASIIDIGAYSSRPNAENISSEEEMHRLRMGLEVLKRNHPDAIISVDTFRADVAEWCVEEYGVAIINDIAAGEMDSEMFETVARLGGTLHHDAYARHTTEHAGGATLR